jgi:kinetochore protein NDC80
LTLSKERDSLNHDKENFQTYQTHLENKKSKALEAARKCTEDVAQAGEFRGQSDVGGSNERFKPRPFVHLETEFRQFQSERDSLQVTVDAQEIRPEDADRMNAEKEQLAQQMGAAQSKAEDISKLVWDREIAVQKRMDQVRLSVCLALWVSFGSNKVPLTEPARKACSRLQHTVLPIELDGCVPDRTRHQIRARSQRSCCQGGVGDKR